MVNNPTSIYPWLVQIYCATSHHYLPRDTKKEASVYCCENVNKLWHFWMVFVSMPLQNLMNAIGSWCWPYFDVHHLIPWHYSNVIMSSMAFRITGVSIVYSTVCSCADQRIHHSSASLAFIRGIHRWPVNCPHKGPVTRRMFPSDDVIRFRCSSSYAMMSSWPTTWHQDQSSSVTLGLAIVLVPIPLMT